jgi:hypothetical protein
MRLYEIITEASLSEAVEMPITLDQLKALKPKTSVAQALPVELWRGIGNGVMADSLKLTAEFAMIDPSEGGTRGSRDSTRYYDLILANHPAWQALPDRKRSVICTTSRNLASQYGRRYRVYPVGDPMVVVCSGHDFWDSFPALIAAGCPSPVTLNFSLAHQAKAMGIPLPDDDFAGFAKALDRMAEAHQRAPTDEMIASLFITGRPVDRLMALFDPKANGFQTMPLSQLGKRRNREVWFSAPSVLVSDRYLGYPR